MTTNLAQWRLKVEHGRQTWHYIEDEAELIANPQSTVEKYWLGLLSHSSEFAETGSALDAAKRGLQFYSHLQTEDGHFAGEYGGPMFLIPGLVIVMYITGSPYPAGFKAEIVRYLCARANVIDGGWGIHIEGRSTVFGTALNYVALRLLGVSKQDPVCVKARETLLKLGGAVGIPTWGKFWLSVLNVYDWAGNNPIPPELWIIPQLLPIHPSRMWCHTRLVYLPMSYLYGIKYKCDENELIRSLREELYCAPYEEIDWSQQRDCIAEVDLYVPTSTIMNYLNAVCRFYEYLPHSVIRSYSLEVVLSQIVMEDENTDYLDIGPVNKVMNMLICWIVDGPDSKKFQKHLERIPDFMWLSTEGMMMNGTNGSQVWDTAFLIQAVMEGDLSKDSQFRTLLVNAYKFLDDMQIRENPKWHLQSYRQSTKGAWPFSTRDQGYTVSDCTAEGLKAVLIMQKKFELDEKLVDDERLFDAVDVLLTMQNSDGGFASYEDIRGPSWLELLNPAQVFGNIMIEYSYVECTTAVLLSLTTFQKYYPFYREHDINRTKELAVKFIRKNQNEDGSWYGSWGICFTYGMFFSVESLALIGECYENSESMKKACDYLVSKQMSDGGWGESYQSCELKVWVNHSQSQVVQTAWALLALMAAKYPNFEVINRGIELIKSRQLSNGEWLQEGIEGVFNKNCMISYPNYKFIFPIWCLSRFDKIYKQ